MRILLDESVPRQLAPLLTGHEVATVAQMGWAGRKNGELLRLATPEFAAFVTLDRNLEHQQNLERIGIGIAVLVARDSRIQSLAPLIPDLLRALAALRPGQLVHIGS
jgi:hypothetical protein